MKLQAFNLTNGAVTFTFVPSPVSARTSVEVIKSHEDGRDIFFRPLAMARDLWKRLRGQGFRRVEDSTYEDGICYATSAATNETVVAPRHGYKRRSTLIDISPTPKPKRAPVQGCRECGEAYPTTSHRCPYCRCPSPAYIDGGTVEQWLDDMADDF